VAVDGNSLGEGPGPFEIPLCSDQVTVTLRDGRTKSAGLTLRPKLNRVRLEFAGKKRARQEAAKSQAEDVERRRRRGGVTQRLAVLELSGAFGRDILSVFSDQVRLGALTALKGTAYEVMTRENMAIMARSMGIDLAACQWGAECEVDLARNIGADLVISGGLTRVGATLIASLKLHDTEKGSLLATKSVRAATEDELFDSLPGAAAALIRAGLGLSP
jgi:hypothetical protein